MAYTYSDFVSAATQAGLLEQFSDSDLQIAQKSPEFGLSILSLKKDAAAATTAEQKLLAEEAANQLRSSYGANNAGTGSFEYKKQNAYQEILDGIVNQGSFEYNPESDPTWSSYQKAYRREGERATANALAQTAAMTGGVPSSYAATAAAQAGNYYAELLADKLPELRQNAYQEHLNDITLQMNKLSALDADREFDYQNYLQEYANALNSYQLLGYATPEVAKILGIETGGGASVSTESGTRYNGSDIDNGSLQGSQIKEMQDYLGMSGNGLWGPNSVQKAMEKWGVSTADEAWSRYQQEVNGGLPPNIISQLKTSYPNGVVDADAWNNLSKTYGQDALTAAGFSQGMRMKVVEDFFNINTFKGDYDSYKKDTELRARQAYKVGQINEQELTFILENLYSMPDRLRLTGVS